MPVLYSLKQLYEFQKDENVRSIWVVSNKVHRHTSNHFTAEVIKENIIKRTVTYKLITTKSSADVAFARGIKGFSEDKEKFAFKIVPEEEFNQLAVTDYLLINPENEAEVEVYIELPVSPRDSWMKVDEDAACGFLLRFSKILGDYPAV
jgi:hypothetical protein